MGSLPSVDTSPAQRFSQVPYKCGPRPHVASAVQGALKARQGGPCSPCSPVLPRLVWSGPSCDGSKTGWRENP